MEFLPKLLWVTQFTSINPKLFIWRTTLSTEISVYVAFFKFPFLPFSIITTTYASLQLKWLMLFQLSIILVQHFCKSRTKQTEIIKKLLAKYHLNLWSFYTINQDMGTDWAPKLQHKVPMWYPAVTALCNHHEAPPRIQRVGLARQWERSRVQFHFWATGLQPCNQLTLDCKLILQFRLSEFQFWVCIIDPKGNTASFPKVRLLYQLSHLSALW